MIYAMERSGTVPEVFGRVHPRFGIPRPAMWFNLVVSFIFLFFFRGWGKLAAVDLKTGKVGGTCGIYSRTGTPLPLYLYRIECLPPLPHDLPPRSAASNCSTAKV